jgi:hypothetical protein
MRVVTKMSEARRVLLAKAFAGTCHVNAICDLFTIDEILQTVSARIVTTLVEV